VAHRESSPWRRTGTKGEFVFRNKNRFAGATIGAACLASGLFFGGLAQGATTGKPEIDRANATVSLQGNLTAQTCAGEDGVGYFTYSGSWKGGETQIVPDATDYPLSGPLTVSGIEWTINASTLRGVLTGKVTLTNAAKATENSGTLVVITQGPPSGSALATGRGWIVGNFKVPDEGVKPNDDFLYTNVEFTSMTAGGAVGAFGDDPGTITPPSVSDFSVVANTPPKGAETCQATATSNPEIDRASATISLQGSLPVVQCTGEDKIGYETYTGTWIGGETQIVPDPTDYPLSGPLTVSGIKWTINLKTDRGVFVGKASLTLPGTTTPEYAGTLVVITQGLPTSTAAPAMGRGWLVSNFKLPDEGATPNDDYLYANVEFPMMTVGGATGAFGDDPGTVTPPSVPDYSVVANTPPKATEVC
jgi:hypothetical protein